MNKKRRIWINKGISLIENLISIALFLFIVMGVLEVFSLSRDHFKKIKSSQEANTAACVALDKIRGDLQQCGKGFTDLSCPEIVTSLKAEGNTLILRRVEGCFYLNNPLFAGQTRIPLLDTSDFKKGMELIFASATYGEIQTISSVDSTGIVLFSSLINSYSIDESEFHLLNKISFYLDKSKKILRRKVNSSPAQPLCEEVESFLCSFAPETNLVKIFLTLTLDPEKIYEISVFPKNTALSTSR